MLLAKSEKIDCLANQPKAPKPTTGKRKIYQFCFTFDAWTLSSLSGLITDRARQHSSMEGTPTPFERVFVTFSDNALCSS